MQKLLYWLAPFYTLFVAYGSLASRPPLPDITFSYIDKVYHCVGYIIMMLVWYLFFYHRFLERQLGFEYSLKSILSDWSQTIAVASAIFSLVIGGSIELGQEFFSNNRTMDFYDMVANTAGIIIATLFLWLLPKFISTDN